MPGPAVELHAFAAVSTQTAIVLGEGQAARFVPVTELPDMDLSPTAAAVLHRVLRSLRSSTRSAGVVQN
jgi:8-oxo-dGTP diphosphatase